MGTGPPGGGPPSEVPFPTADIGAATWDSGGGGPGSRPGARPESSTEPDTWEVPRARRPLRLDPKRRRTPLHGLSTTSLIRRRPRPPKGTHAALGGAENATARREACPLPHPRRRSSPAGSPQRGGLVGGRPEPASPGPDCREETVKPKKCSLSSEFLAFYDSAEDVREMRTFSRSRGRDGAEGSLTFTRTDGLCPSSKGPRPRGARGAARVSCSLSPAASSHPGGQAPTADGAHTAPARRVCRRVSCVSRRTRSAQQSRKNGGEERASEVTRLAGGRAAVQARGGQRAAHAPVDPSPGTGLPGPAGAGRAQPCSLCVRRALPGATGVTVNARNQF